MTKGKERTFYEGWVGVCERRGWYLQMESLINGLEEKSWDLSGKRENMFDRCWNGVSRANMCVHAAGRRVGSE